MTQTNQNLESYYDSLGDKPGAKTEFIKRVSNECKKVGAKTSHVAIRQWVKGCNETQDEKRLKVLSEVSGIAIENLFN
jgi:hypothetical protein